MTDITKYVADAIKELDLVKSEGSLIAWSDCWCNSVEYASQLSVAEVRALEDAYDRKLRRFMPAGLAG